ncbi:MAG: isochorismatase [Verrucomicrobiota bacterium]
MEPYAPRSFRFIELLMFGDWRMKLYGIAWRDELPRTELLGAAIRVAADTLAKETANNYKVGFIGAHDGRGACFVFVDFWGNENELFHRVYLSRLNQPEKLTPSQSSDSSVCVWDLRLQAFEREAWIKHVLLRSDAPNFDGYLAERLNEDG